MFLCLFMIFVSFFHFSELGQWKSLKAASLLFVVRFTFRFPILHHIGCNYILGKFDLTIILLTFLSSSSSLDVKKKRKCIWHEQQITPKIVSIFSLMVLKIFCQTIFKSVQQDPLRTTVVGNLSFCLFRWNLSFTLCITTNNPSPSLVLIPFSYLCIFIISSIRLIISWEVILV